MKKLLLICLTSLFGLIPFGAVATPAGEHSYTFSVAPQFERRKLFGIWQPIIDELQRHTGLRFELATSLSVSEYDSDAKNGRYDLIYVNPYMMPLIDRQPGYQPLIRDGAPLTLHPPTVFPAQGLELSRMISHLSSTLIISSILKTRSL